MYVNFAIEVKGFFGTRSNPAVPEMMLAELTSLCQLRNSSKYLHNAAERSFNYAKSYFPSVALRKRVDLYDGMRDRMTSGPKDR